MYVIDARWRVVRRAAGYTAAGAMSLYLFVKIIWIVAALAGHGPDDVGTAGWVGVNAVTVGMSATGVGLGLALAGGWRLPARPVIFLAWTGSGFLVSMIPFMLLSAVLSVAGDGHASSGSRSPLTWERVLITIGFAGMALGLAVGLPIYLRERWPRAFEGRGGTAGSRLAVPAMVGSAVLGALWLYWWAGGTYGLRHTDLNGRLLCASAGLWALVACWSVRALSQSKTQSESQSRLPLWAPISLAFAVFEHTLAVLTGLAVLRIAYVRQRG